MMKVRVQPRPRNVLEAHIDLDEWHIDHIQQGLREAKAGQFASAAQVNRVMARIRKK
jgi:predicted transcriptional regulator